MTLDMYPEKQSKIIVWCNELHSVRALTDTLARSFQLVSARDPGSFMSLMGQDVAPVAALIDNAAAQGKAIDTLQAVRKVNASIRRILLTDYCDLAIIVQGLHTEAIQKIVYKPIHGPELLGAIGQAAIVPLMPAATHRSSSTRAM